MTHPQNCETCEYNDNHYCELYKCRVSFSEVSTLEQVGCASHSDAGKEREKVLRDLQNIIAQHCGEGIHKGWLLAYPIDRWIADKLRQGGE